MKQETKDTYLLLAGLAIGFVIDDLVGRTVGWWTFTLGAAAIALIVLPSWRWSRRP